MKTISYVLSVGFILILCSNSCRDNDGYKLRVNNTSNKSIYVKWTTFPDTCLKYVVNPLNSPQINRVEAHSIQQSYYGDASRGLFDGKMQKLSVFIFDAQILESTPWDTVQAKNMVLKRYDLTLQELENIQWMVTYP